MTLESIIDTYGYVAVVVGTFFEGETILVLGGVAAQRGYLNLFGVMAAAFIGSFCGDQLFFYLGRKHSEMILARRPSWRAGPIQKAKRLLERIQTPLILGFRFLYGLRTVMPFVIGMSSVPVRRFVFLNFMGALVWSVVVAAGGYVFGHALEAAIRDIKHYEAAVLGAIAAVGAVVWAVFFIRRRRKNRLRKT